MTMTAWECFFTFVLAYILVNGILACVFVLIALRRVKIIDEEEREANES